MPLSLGRKCNVVKTRENSVLKTEARIITPLNLLVTWPLGYFSWGAFLTIEAGQVFLSFSALGTSFGGFLSVGKLSCHQRLRKVILFCCSDSVLTECWDRSPAFPPLSVQQPCVHAKKL